MLCRVQYFQLSIKIFHREMCTCKGMKYANILCSCCAANITVILYKIVIIFNQIESCFHHKGFMGELKLLNINISFHI